MESRPFGGAFVLDAQWRRLGVGEAIVRALGARRFATDVERVLFALVANRALKPFSKLAAADWASCDAQIQIRTRRRRALDDAYEALEAFEAAAPA